MTSKRKVQRENHAEGGSCDDVVPERADDSESAAVREEYCEFNEESVRMLCRSQLSNEEIAAKCERSVEELERLYGERLNEWRAAGIGHGKLLLFQAACKRSVTAIALFLKRHGPSGSADESLENSIVKYKAQLRTMSDNELGEEIKRQEIACGSQTRHKASGSTQGSEAPPN